MSSPLALLVAYGVFGPRAGCAPYVPSQHAINAEPTRAVVDMKRLVAAVGVLYRAALVPTPAHNTGSWCHLYPLHQKLVTAMSVARLHQLTSDASWSFLETVPAVVTFHCLALPVGRAPCGCFHDE